MSVTGSDENILNTEMRMDLTDATWETEPDTLARVLSAKTRRGPIQIDEIDDLGHYEVLLDDWEDIYQTNKIHRFKLISSNNSRVGRSHYQDLANYLNNGIDWCKKALGNRVKSYNKDLRFSVWDKETMDGVQDTAPAQPDLAGAAGLPPNPSTLSWRPKSGARKETMEIPIEVNDNWPDLVMQAATYARCLKHANPFRLFELVIGYMYKKKELRFLYFHPGGLVASKAMKIDSSESRGDMIKLLLALLTWDDKGDAGQPLSVDDSSIYIQQDRDDERGHEMNVESVLYSRIGVWGRNTQVLLLGPKESTPRETAISQINDYIRQPQDPLTTADIAQGPRRSLRMKEQMTNKHVARPKKRKQGDPEPEHSNAPQPRFEETSNPNPTKRYCRHSDSFIRHPIIAFSKPITPESEQVVAKFLFAKQSSAPMESNMLKECSNMFGLPEHYYSCLVYLKNNVPANNHLVYQNAVFWRLFRLDAATYQPPPPELYCLVTNLIQYVGDELVNADSPQTLFWAIIHAMIGYRNLLLKGYLHRDISIGNVLWSKQEIKVKSALGEESDKEFNALLQKHGIDDKCHGFVIDGDMAIKLAAALGEEHKHTPLGTSVFMSTNLLDAAERKQAYTQSPIDDIWSFFWVAHYAAIFNDRHFPSGAVPRSLESLRKWVTGAAIERDGVHTRITTKYLNQLTNYGSFLFKSRIVFEQWHERLNVLGVMRSWDKIKEHCTDVDATRAQFEITINQAIKDLLTIVTSRPSPFDMTLIL